MMITMVHSSTPTPSGYKHVGNNPRRAPLLPHHHKLERGTQTCPCSNASLCDPLTIGPRKEFVGFTTAQDAWTTYNLAHLTTLIMFTDPDPQIICQAHAAGARISVGVGFDVSQIFNETYKEIFIANTIGEVTYNYYDGFNMDFEATLFANQSMESALFTELMIELAYQLKQINAGYQVSIDLAPGPYCYWNRCYDTFGLSQVSDIMIVMDYDMNINGLAGANCDLPELVSATSDYLAIHVPPEKIINGYPWYAYNYTCQSNMTLETRNCYYDTTYRWQSFYINQLTYSQIVTLLNTSITTSGMQWDDVTQTPFFNFVDTSSNTVRQMWFDNPDSLTIKVQAAKKLGVGGVAVWLLDDVDPYNQPTETAAMWNAMYSFFD
ncbi:hypothetical protein SAMD00019534_122570 [Acytostelium subglobosum LB1]|nr:hypothetical protein SAMD00019534_122570 [Acytostelium subglobosum LB1]GAM29081.1 hypothetical protein SAMD00019534_122570 [Acytostelium subglobosum LB1]|eukprot:XP_012747926.1 hypothetical protein SAMD00019534_122570 [Acytostelium subglobosum LB1]